MFRSAPVAFASFLLLGMANPPPPPIKFRCKFDENMLGFAGNLIEDSVIKARFAEPNTFADDVEMESESFSFLLRAFMNR